ncbi:iron ABC transporter permease [Massilia sp. MAHUQ-52]|uniref:Iron ABC transporter permease n=2 Tax=Telluria group TaxID=2895353 RepID=A0ABS8IVN2_9BURK|nr:iron ABC transporter permease [Massilia agrisoli]MCC6072531.1 iron ABC transporter permease [Massilia agrisoli]
MATAVLVLLAASCFAVAGLVGSVPVPLTQLPAALAELAGGAGSSLAATLLDLRLSRALTAFVTGASLALAGVMMQALLRNPLADPYTLGISAGASVGAVAALLFMAPAWAVDASALAGAAGVSALLYLLARRGLDGAASVRGGARLLLLTGVVLSSACMAMVTLMLSIAPESRLRSMIFWMIGDIAGAPVRATPWIVLAGVLVFALRSARSLNVLAVHDGAAATLGVRVGPTLQKLFFCSALLTATAVASAGSIGFVGLIIPHALRFAFGADHRVLIPAATLAGGTFLVLADTLARTVVAPQQLPVGVITALVGAPVFLYQLHRLRSA